MLLRESVQLFKGGGTTTMLEEKRKTKRNFHWSLPMHNERMHVADFVDSPSSFL